MSAIRLRLNTKSEQKQVGVVSVSTVSDLQQQILSFLVYIASNWKAENVMKFQSNLYDKQEQSWCHSKKNVSHVLHPF